MPGYDYVIVGGGSAGCVMNGAAKAAGLVGHVMFGGEDWLHFPAFKPDVAISERDEEKWFPVFLNIHATIKNRDQDDVAIKHHPDLKATTADENGNLTYEDEGATLGAIEMALSARNSGGIVVAQAKRVMQNGALRPNDVRVSGIPVDVNVKAPDQLQTTSTQYDPAISAVIFRPLPTFEVPEFGVSKVMTRGGRATELAKMLINAAEGEKGPRVMEALAGSIAAGSEDLRQELRAFAEMRKPDFGR